MHADDLAPEVRASLDAQTLAFLRAVDRFHPDPDGTLEADRVEWSAGVLRRSIDRVYLLIEEVQALHGADLDTAVAGARWCPGCAGTGVIAGVLDGEPTSDLCPACGGRGHFPTPKENPTS